MKILVNVSRLPKPPYPPTVPFRTIEKPETRYEECISKESEEKMAERRMRAAESARKTYALRHGYTPEQEQELIDLYKQGLACKVIAEKVGRNEKAVKQKIDKLKKVYGIEREHPLQRVYTKHKPESEIVRKNHYTPAQDAVICEMIAQKKSFAEIGDQLGKSKEAVRKRWYRISGLCGGG